MSEIVTNKNGVEFDIDAIATDLNGKADVDLSNVTVSSLVRALTNAGLKICVESWHDNNGNWYRVYSDGWCEQGGEIPYNSVNPYIVTFLKPFKDTNYTVFTSAYWSGVNANGSSIDKISATSSQVKITRDGTSMGESWEAKGYIS